MSHTNNILINKLINDINYLGTDKNKNEFIENYSIIKDKINKTDLILDSKNNIDSNLSIQELFNIIEKNKDKILNSEELDINTLKYLSDVIEILDNKINNESIEIKENK